MRNKRVNRLLSGILLIIAFIPIIAVAQTIKLSSGKNGKVRIRKGQIVSVIDLSKDLSGCPIVYDGSDPNGRKIDVTEFELIDSISKGPSIYLVLLATMGGNCNIQGECGATEDLTLVWLKLDKQLKTRDKKAVAIDSCRYNRIQLASPVKLVNGELKIEYSEIHYQEDQEYTVCLLNYKKIEAEKGFTIVSTKRISPKN